MPIFTFWNGKQTTHDTMIKNKKTYCRPAVSDEASVRAADMLCDSYVEAGGSEDLVYVDWSDLTEAGE